MAETGNANRPGRLTLLLSAASFLWIAGIAYQAAERWPQLPLDVSASDPATRAAYEAAVNAHVVRAIALGMAVPLLAYGVHMLVAKMRG